MIRQGHVLAELAKLEPESVNCVVTSPPYWSLRKYDAEDVTWGGDAECDHDFSLRSIKQLLTGGVSEKQSTNVGSYVADQHGNRVAECAECAECGAWRGQYGLEPTPDLYVEHTLDVLREIRRVLRPDGVVFWNIGDGYSGSGQGYGDTKTTNKNHAGSHQREKPLWAVGLKPKDLVLMPERVALAAQADGWWVRSRIVWSKPNAMPESVRDRPTNAHETIWMLTKSARYFWDQEAVREPGAVWIGQAGTFSRNGDVSGHVLPGQGYAEHRTGRTDRVPAGRNVRDVWTFPTAQTPEAHFATFPEELPKRCILAACPPGGLVLDPFCGIGTTGVVARRLGREFVGIELSPKYAEIAGRKIALALHETARPTPVLDGQAVLPL